MSTCWLSVPGSPCTCLEPLAEDKDKDINYSDPHCFCKELKQGSSQTLLPTT